MAGRRESHPVVLVAMLSITAFVIVILAFFFSSPYKGASLMIGQPHEAPYSSRETQVSRTDDSARIDSTAARADNGSEVVCENRLSQGRNLLEVCL